MTEAAPLIQLKALRRVYATEDVETHALGGIDLTIGRGEYVTVEGPSGCGKSTLLTVLGLLDEPTSGEYILAGTPVSHIDAEERARLRNREIGFVFQFHHLLPAFSAVENVMLPAWGDEGLPSREMRQNAEQLLRAVGLEDRMHFKTTDLSGGQQQRVAIARALARKPPLILADEPTGNLDTESANEVFELLRRFNRELGTSCLIVTHDPRIAERCDRTITIVDGKVV